MKARKPLQIFLAVQKALFLRELNMRLSIGKTGLFWTFFEPFLQTSLFISIRVFLIQSTGTSASQGNFDYVVFMASGFIAFNMFRNILSGATGAFSANKALFSYKQVKPVDTIIARILLNMFLTTMVLMMFLFVGFLFQYEIKPENLAMVFLGYLWLLLFSFSVSFLLDIGNHFYLSIGKFINAISLLLLIGSAVFFPIISLPPAAQKILLYNPLVHFMEMIHGYYIVGLDTHFVDYHYMVLWTIIPLFMAMWLYTKLQERIISE